MSEAVNQAGGKIWEVLGGGLASLGKYKIFFFIILGLIIIGTGLYIYSLFSKKKKQWTHKIEVQRILPNGKLTEKEIKKARRFSINNGTENFELEKPILGNYIIPRVGDYIDNNTLGLVLDKDNRIYKKEDITWNKDKSCEEISLVHAGVDVTWNDLKEKYQHAHKNTKKITTRELIKAGITALLIIASVIVLIVALGNWSEVHKYKIEEASQQAKAMEQLNEALSVMEGVVATQQHQITPIIKAMYDTDNIADIINEYKE